MLIRNLTYYIEHHRKSNKGGLEVAKLNRHLNVKVDQQSFDRLAGLRCKLGLPLSEIARRAIAIAPKRLDHAKLPGGPPEHQQQEFDLKEAESWKKV
jgi:hypothetical protein